MKLIGLLDKIKSIYTQANTGNFRPILDSLAENVIFKSTILDGTPISGNFIGKKMVMDYYTKLLPSVATFKQLIPMKFVISEDKVIIVGENAFTLVKNGNTYQRPYVSIIKIRDGLISEITLLQDLFGIYLAYQSPAEEENI
ncbi:MAG TPA: nuclear transport factor 2 family protein [Pseudosphingobacterium sp.]|nr:nuclear transport factor 2 family protein [Pseudosphingobacterium sp.]